MHTDVKFTFHRVKMLLILLL